jgi:hypothetical protein
VLTYKNGDKYEGDFAEGMRHGNGAMWRYRAGKYILEYEGGWAQDKPHVSNSHPQNTDSSSSSSGGSGSGRGLVIIIITFEHTAPVGAQLTYVNTVLKLCGTIQQCKQCHRQCQQQRHCHPAVYSLVDKVEQNTNAGPGVQHPTSQMLTGPCAGP